MSVKLGEILPLARIEHIGSTAVPGLPAKPVVDLAVGVAEDDVVRSARELARCGFDLEGERDNHAWLSSPDRSARAFVIHVLEFQGEEWIKRLRFRDILMTDKVSREKYLAAKREASSRANGWGEYTSAKSSVVSEILTHAVHSTEPAEGTGSRNQSISAVTQDPERSASADRQAPGTAGIHHVEIRIADAAPARTEWGWLLQALNFTRANTWAEGESWAAGGAYLTLTTSPNLAGTTHDRRAPGVNHLAFKAGTPSAVDAIMAVAPRHGWKPLYQDRYPHAGGPAHYAGWLENSSGFKAEVVANDS